MARTPEWQYQKSQELKYARQLRKVAEHSGAIVDAHINEDAELEDVAEMMATSEMYSQALTPWANRVAAAMIASVAKSNERSWKKNSEIIARELSVLIDDSNIAPTIKMLQAQQVQLITSIPTEAAARAQALSAQAAIGGGRSDEVSEMIQNTTAVTKSRANLIARTEIAKTNANITQARAGLVGSTHYKWRTMEDGAVRPSHQEMANKTFTFGDPPAVEGEGNHGPGDYPNCFRGSEKVNRTSFIEVFSRRGYSGELTRLVSSDGAVFYSTPNHPILTLNGFKPAYDVNVLDKIVCISDKAFGVIKNNINYAEPTFEQIFNSINMLPAFKGSTLIGGEFHGDSTNDEVDIIRPNSTLILERYSVVCEKLRELGLSDSDSRLCEFILVGDSGCFELIKTSYSSFTSFMSRLDLVRSVLVRHFAPFDLFCFALGPDINGTDKMASDYPSINTEMFRDCIFAYSLLVHGLNLINVKVDSIMSSGDSFFDNDSFRPKMPAKDAWAVPDNIRGLLEKHPAFYKTFSVKDKFSTDFFGHVYNLQTKTGYYHTQSVLASNCRCYAEVII